MGPNEATLKKLVYKYRFSVCRFVTPTLDCSHLKKYVFVIIIFLCIQLPTSSKKNAGNSVALAGPLDLRTYRVWTFLVCSLRCGVCVCVCVFGAV